MCCNDDATTMQPIAPGVTVCTRTAHWLRKQSAAPAAAMGIGVGAVYAASFTLGFLPWYLAWYCLFLPRECMFSNINLKGDIWLSGQDSKSQQTGSQHAICMVQLLEPGRSSIART